MTAHEQLFVNGKVFTARGEADFATAFHIAGGAFTWVGDSDDVDASRAIDLQGRTVLPGLIDVHTHPAFVAETVRAVPCTVPRVTSIAEMIAALRTHHNHGGGPDDWIEGWGYDESKLAGHRTPTRHDLDQVSTTQPVFVFRSDFHSAVCNTRALELAGITRDTPDPTGGRFVRDEHGEPNGLLEELGARDAVMAARGVPDHEARVNAILGTGAHYNERGIIAVSDMAIANAPLDALQVYRDAQARGFRQQAALYFMWRGYDCAVLTNAQKRGRANFAGVKLFADGSLSGRTAWVLDPYRGSDACGYPTTSREELRAAHAFAARNGVQVAVHAMGDRALQWVIDHFAAERPWLDDVPSVRLEHLSLLRDEEMERMAASPMTFGGSTQIVFLFAEYDSYHENLRDDVFRRAYPVRSVYERIPHVGLSSDAPATTWSDPDNVFVSIEAAVTRMAYNGADINSDQAITVPQAVLLYTARAATVAPYDGKLGRIAPGYEGSFVVLDRDIFTISPTGIHEAAVAQTWIQGDKVYDRE